MVNGMRRLGSLLLFAFPIATHAEDARLSRLQVLLVPMRAVQMANLTRGATPELTVIKHELRDWVESHLSELHWYEDPKRLEQKLNGDLRQAKLFCRISSWPNDSPCPDWTALGFLGKITLGIQQNGSFLVLQTAVGIQQCGFDESVYAYQWTDDHWQRFWESEQDDYAEKKYFPQTLQAVLISPTNRDRNADKNEHLVLTLGTEPWCTSAWHPVYFRAWKTSSSYSMPMLLLNGTEDSYLGSDPPIKGSVGPSDLLIEYAVGSIDGGVHNRREIRHYQVNNDKINRVDPIVLSPRDFVDEWIRHPWAEMAHWTEGSGLRGLRKLHERWSGSLVFGEFIYPTLHCEEKPDLWQAGIRISDKSGKEEAPEYFLIRWRPPYHFTMVDASDHPWPGCTEQDRKADEFRTLFPGDWH
ncbi:MAG TPA: hypothetical protein VLW25_02295 [Bryobacteraceae bacterium]|nr:hypothetical protein [Bryobacteraceae bacterium]